MTPASASAEARRYGRAAGLLTAAIGCAGVLTYAYFALASHTLSREDYGQIVVLWSAVFLAVSTLFRPIEQLLSRTLAELESHGQPVSHALRTAFAIQLALACAFAVLALAVRGPLEDGLLDGEGALFTIMIVAVLGFGGGFFARGFLAGRRQFRYYAALLLVDATTRAAFALAVTLGIAEGEVVVALGIAAAPLASLVVLPLALRGRRVVEQAVGGTGLGAPEFTVGKGSAFAAAVLAMMLSEQVLLNSGPLIVQGSLGVAAAGFIFNVLMVARAPLLLFQAIAASLLPHLTRLLSSGDEVSAEAFRLSLRATLMTIAGFAVLTLLGVLAVGPQVMQIAFGDQFDYDRIGLAIVAAGMGFYLSAATLNQAVLAQGQARRAAGRWVACAILFIAWNALPWIDELRRVETGFAGAAVILAGLLYRLYLRPRPRPEDVIAPGSASELEVRLATAEEAAGGV